MRQRGQFSGVLSLILIVFVAVLFQLRTVRAAQSVGDSAPTVVVHLKDLADSRLEFRSCVVCVQFAFIDDNTLALTFETADRVNAKPERGYAIAPIEVAFRTVFIDGRTGKLLAEHDWPRERQLIHLHPTHDGRFLITSSEEIRLYSSNFELSRHRTLPAKGPGSEFSNAIVSWDGRRIAIRSFEEHRSRIQLLDSDSFELLNSWLTSETNLALSASDDTIVVESRSGMQYSTGDAIWQPLARPCHSPQVRLFADPHFASNRDIAVADCDGSIVLMSLDGVVSFRNEEKLSPYESYEYQFARSGRVFAVFVNRVYCATPWIACPIDPVGGQSPDSISVFDRANHTSVFKRSVPKFRKNREGGLAISPDGHFVAMMYDLRPFHTDGNVEIFDTSSRIK